MARAFGAVKVLVFSAALLIVCAGPSAAGPIFDFTTGGAAIGPLPGKQMTVGWSFSLSTPLTVDALGVWDDGRSSQTLHTVGLWTGSGALLASSTVDHSSAAVASSTSGGQWLFAPVTPFTLQPGSYVVGAFYTAAAAPSPAGSAAGEPRPAGVAIESGLDRAAEGVPAPESAFMLRVLDQMGGTDGATEMRAAIDPEPDLTPSFVTIPGVTYTGGKSGRGDTLSFPGSQFSGGGFGPNLSAQQQAQVPEPLSLTLLCFGLAWAAVRFTRRTER